MPRSLQDSSALASTPFASLQATSTGARHPSRPFSPSPTRASMMLSSLMPPTHMLSPPTTPPTQSVGTVKASHSSMDAFCADVESNFRAPLQIGSLHNHASRLREQFRDCLSAGSANMLPSFHHTLPSGLEKGSFLALDVGGSTFRVALVELAGRAAGSNATAITMQRDYRIDDAVRALQGVAFFDWMAERIQEAFAGREERSLLHAAQPLPMGLAWSFPVAQRSIRDGDLLQMGKDFRSADGLIGQNLADLVSAACQRKAMNIDMRALVNDSDASLLSKAYLEPNTHMSLILGTGLNAAAHLPVHAIGSQKFGIRPASWHTEASRVIVNTELSMFGRCVFPISRWDHRLNLNHPCPDYQPLEHLTSGRYLPEIVRLILLEAIQTAGLFNGEVPSGFEPYAIRAELLSTIEGDTSPRLFRSLHSLAQAHPLPSGASYTYSDIQHVQRITELVSSRAAAYLAVSIYSLWMLRLEEEGIDPAKAEDTCLGCTGSVMDKYPSFCNRVQYWLDELTGSPDRIRLEMVQESALLGAAVAVCCQDPVSVAVQSAEVAMENATAAPQPWKSASVSVSAAAAAAPALEANTNDMMVGAPGTTAGPVSSPEYQAGLVVPATIDILGA